MIELDRGDFLRLSGGGVIAATVAGLVAGAAVAQVPRPVPKEDDVAYLSFAAVAERASRDAYRAAAGHKGAGFSRTERNHLNRVAARKRAHILRLDVALGADAPLTEDFETVLPPGAVETSGKALVLLRQLETLLVRVYLNAIGFAADPATRLLLGRLLAYDAQALSWIHLRQGEASPSGLQSPVDLEVAAEALDGFLTTPAFPD